MKKYHQFLFDWDGCLANTNALWIAAMNEVFSRYQIKLSPSQVASCLGDTKKPIEFGVSDSKFWEYVLAIVSDSFPQTPLFPDTITMLKVLHDNQNQIAIVSSSLKQLIQKAIEYHKIAEYVTLIVGFDDVTILKPDPEPLKLAISKLNADKRNSLMIGDSPKDILAANNASIDSVAFMPQENSTIHNDTEIRAANPTYIIKSFGELITHLQA